MSFLGGLLRRAAKVPAAQVVEVAERLIELARQAKGDRDRYRQLLRAAVESGDLDGPLHTFKQANARANDYIKKG